MDSCKHHAKKVHSTPLHVTGSSADLRSQSRRGDIGFSSGGKALWDDPGSCLALSSITRVTSPLPSMHPHFIPNIHLAFDVSVLTGDHSSNLSPDRSVYNGYLLAPNPSSLLVLKAAMFTFSDRFLAVTRDLPASSSAFLLS